MDVIGQIEQLPEQRENHGGVVITGIDIPVTDLMVLLVKIAVAAIPATIIVTAIGGIIFAILAMMFR